MRVLLFAEERFHACAHQEEGEHETDENGDHELRLEEHLPEGCELIGQLFHCNGISVWWYSGTVKFVEKVIMLKE